MARKHQTGKYEASKRLLMPDGTRKRLSVYGSTVEEADSRLNELVADINRACVDTRTVKGYAINCYLPTVENLSHKAREQIAWAIDSHIVPAIGNRDLAEVTRQEIQTLLNAKLNNLKVGTVGHIRKVLFAIWNLAEADDKARNVVRHTKLPSARKQPTPIYTAKQCWALIDAAKGHPVSVPILLAAFAGLRRGECLALRWTDVKASGLHIEKQAQRQFGEMVETELKTASSYRVVPVSHEFVKVLRSLGKLSDEFVCGSERGTMMIQDNVDRALYAAEKRAGLHKITFHQLRHSFSTNLQALGCPEEIRSALLGHSKGSMTQHYTQMSRQQSRMWLKKLVCTFIEKKATANTTANTANKTPKSVEKGEKKVLDH